MAQRNRGGRLALAQVEPTATSTERFRFPTPSASKSVCRAVEIGGAPFRPMAESWLLRSRHGPEDARSCGSVRSPPRSPAHGRPEGAIGIPFWSLSSRYVVFGADTKPKKMEASWGTGPNLNHCGRRSCGRIVDPEGKIVFDEIAPTATNQVSASGGTATPVRWGITFGSFVSTLRTANTGVSTGLKRNLHPTRWKMVPGDAAPISSGHFRWSPTLQHRTRSRATCCLCAEPP